MKNKLAVVANEKDRLVNELFACFMADAIKQDFTDFDAKLDRVKKSDDIAIANRGKFSVAASAEGVSDLKMKQ
jgi:hypothetical protein